MPSRKVSPEPITVSKDRIGIIQTNRFPSPPGEEERFELRFLDSPSFVLNDEGDYLISGSDTCPHLKTAHVGDLLRVPVI